MFFVTSSKKNIRSLLMYKVNFFMGVSSISIVGIISALLVWVVTGKANTIMGWSMKEIIFLISLWRLPHAFFIMFFLQLWSLDHKIRNGEFDIYFLRPRSVLYQFLSSSFSTAGIGEFIAAIAGLIYSIEVIKLDLFTILVVISIVIFGLILELSIHLIISTTAFWTLQSSGLLDFVDRINFTLKQYPMNIYSKPLQYLLTFVLPFGFMSYFPAHIVLKASHPPIISEIMPYLFIPISVIVCIISLYFWHFGIKKYEGSGT